MQAYTKAIQKTESKIIKTFQITKKTPCQTGNSQIVGIEENGTKIRVTLFTLKTEKRIGNYIICGDTGLNEKKLTKLFKTSDKNVFYGDTIRPDIIKGFNAYTVKTKDGVKKLNIKITINQETIIISTRDNDNSKARF